MNRKALTIAFVAAFAVLSLGAETTTTLPQQNIGHYDITVPEGFTGQDALAAGLNGLWSSFNAVFGFDPDTSKHRLKVTVLPDRAAFDAYVKERIGETRNQYIFLKYPRAELSELVLFPAGTGTGFDAFSGPALNRQLFLQYLYCYVQEPPLWVRDGFQAYFEKAVWDPATKQVSIAGYSPWLEAAKNLHADGARSIGCEGLLSAVTGSHDSAAFYPQAWSFATFLLSSEKAEYQRFLHEAFMILEGTEGYNAKTQRENTDAVRARFARFNDGARADSDLAVWLDGQHTFNELVQAGVSGYNGGKYPDAKKALLSASTIRPADPIVSYYLGLVAYSEKDYQQAEKWYKKALSDGADVSTANWALGLNAYADKRFKDARGFIEAAKAANPARYGEKADALLNSMPR